MRSAIDGSRRVWIGALALGLAAFATPASADWTQVNDVPTTALFSMWANGDTLAAGADTTVYVSTDAGNSWHVSSKPVAGVQVISAVRVLNGRLYAGTFGQGVFTSDDLGTTWHAFNEGLVGGILNSQLDIDDFQTIGDNLVVATAGAGVYARNLTAGTWHPFGSVFEPEQASNVNALGRGGDRLLASGGANGMVFRRDPGDADWTISFLDNAGIHAGLQATNFVFNGAGWVVGSNLGTFRSTQGQEPWTRTNPGLGPIDWTVFAAQGRHLFAAFDVATAAIIEDSADDGATWQNPEVFIGVFIQALGISGNNLYAARADGLYRRPLETLSAPPSGDRAPLSFALTGAQPTRDEARLRFVLPQASEASIQVFDVLGRATGERLAGAYSTGPHEVSLDTRSLNPGVYLALLTAGATHQAVRLVHVR